MENLTRTGVGSLLQTALFTGTPLTFLPNTTLNELFNIQAGVYPPSNQYPTLGYYSIGYGGHKNSTGADGTPLNDPVQHEATDTGEYKPMPFVLRQDSNDLSAADQAKYALRRVEIWNGLRYYAYYLKRLSKVGIVPLIEQVTVDGDTTVTAPWIPTSANLNPVPPLLSTDGVNVVNGSYLSVTARMDLSLTADEVAEIVAAALVIHNDDRYAVISEIGLCSGQDKQVASPSTGNATIPFNEAIAVQIVSHVDTMYPLKFSPQGVDILLDVGTSEPLFNLATTVAS